MEHPGLFHLETAYQRTLNRGVQRAVEECTHDSNVNLEVALCEAVKYELSLFSRSLPSRLQGCGITSEILLPKYPAEVHVSVQQVSKRPALSQRTGL